ncbi:YbaK/EbsC family protein [Haloplanus ruber]|uniref:YbaK/EbsC family protein n=1 Tax=Haloplanus ruber TaxID=869892 RepID=A0ABD6D0V8_9EURY|nr:YbaK/EbsC family protein [Haloplanus ruber]
MHPTVESFVERAHERHGVDVDVHEFPDGTKTAAAAAEAVDCRVGQIVKSIVMQVGDQPVLVLTSGANRVDEQALAAAFDADPDRVHTADAATVKETTGWSIGGVPPFCHDADLPTLADPAFEAYDTLWAAAGTPETVFPLPTATLVDATDPRFVDVYE